MQKQMVSSNQKTNSSSVTSFGEAIVRSSPRWSSCISMAGLKLDVWGRIGCSIQIHCCGSMIHRSWAFGMSAWSLLDFWSQIPSASWRCDQLKWSWWENTGSNLKKVVNEISRDHAAEWPRTPNAAHAMSSLSAQLYLGSAMSSLSAQLYWT